MNLHFEYKFKKIYSSTKAYKNVKHNAKLYKMNIKVII